MNAVTDPAKDVQPATVLIVDDDPLNRAMLSMSLGSLGHQVIEAGNGLEGIAALGANDVDVVITDIEMPEMDGYGLLEHRAGDDRLKAIPFIVISGVDEMESIIVDNDCCSMMILFTSTSSISPRSIRRSEGTISPALSGLMNT